VTAGPQIEGAKGESVTERERGKRVPRKKRNVAKNLGETQRKREQAGYI
jgi:hypothetical protein